MHLQVKKKQKHKSKGSVRTVTKQVPGSCTTAVEGAKNIINATQVKADSFFNFFEPPTIPDDPKAEVDEDTQVVH